MKIVTTDRAESSHPADEIGASPLPFIIGIAIASHAVLLTPIGTFMKPDGDGTGWIQFSDYSKLGSLTTT